MSSRQRAQVTPEVLEAADALCRLTEKFTLACERAGGVSVFVAWLIDQRSQDPSQHARGLQRQIEIEHGFDTFHIEDCFGVHVSTGTLWDWMQRLGIE